MTLESVDIRATIHEIETLLKEEENLSPALASAIKVMLVVIQLLSDRLGLNSRNSSKPPSSDPNREKKKRNNPNGNPKGGQKGHRGVTLEPVDDPDEIEILEIDRRCLPEGRYREVDVESRQVIDIRISRHVTEYRAQVLENELGERFKACFPDGVTRPVQYGPAVKANAVYMSMFQLIPYDRIQTHFAELFGMPLSAGTLFNFNKDAYRRLESFSELVTNRLAQASLVHADETGINIDGKRVWLHNASNADWTLFYPHTKRGCEAMDEMGVLPHFRGILCHDHWKPYYRYPCQHSLCNAHHIRELTRAAEQDEQQWASDMEALLQEMNLAVIAANGALKAADADKWRRKYRKVIEDGDRECPPPEPEKNEDGSKKRGRPKKSRSRNLLERLRDYEGDVLRFLENHEVPFTNNRGENDLRMTKVQQKISGCFRSFEGAKIFCLVRSYLSTCRKQGVGIGEALECLFAGKWPPFIQTELDKIDH